MQPPVSLSKIPVAECTAPPKTVVAGTASSHNNLLATLAMEAAAFCNVLPFNKGAHKSNGTYIGEGISPVPSKLVDSIRKWEFVTCQSCSLSNGARCR